MTYKDYLEKVGLVVQQMFTPLISSVYGASRVFTGSRGGIKYIVLHTTGNIASARNEALNIHNNPGINSFNAVVDDEGVYETVKFGHTAHHAGNKNVNLESIGFELSDKDARAGYNNFIKYIAWVMYQLGLVPSNSTVRFHNEFANTSCGKFLRDKGKNQIIADLNKYIAIAKSTVTSPEAIPDPPKPVSPSTPSKKYINLTGARYAIYNKNLSASKMIRGNHIGELFPSQFGGLSYTAEKVPNTKNVYLIHTRDFGQVRIADVPGRSTITDKPLYVLKGK